jgi:hypothetical protein
MLASAGFVTVTGTAMPAQAVPTSALPPYHQGYVTDGGVSCIMYDRLPPEQRGPGPDNPVFFVKVGNQGDHQCQKLSPELWAVRRFERPTQTVCKDLTHRVRVFGTGLDAAKHLFTIEYKQSQVCFNGTTVQFTAPPAHTLFPVAQDFYVHNASSPACGVAQHDSGAYADSLCFFVVQSNSSATFEIAAEPLGFGGAGSVTVTQSPKNGRTRLVVRPDGCYEVSGASIPAEQADCL